VILYPAKKAVNFVMRMSEHIKRKTPNKSYAYVLNTCHAFVGFKKVFSFVFLLFVFSGNTLMAQLTTSTSLTPTQLVEDILLGPGVTASGISTSGYINSIGSFNGTLSNIGLNAGVILSTGEIVNATGPNNADGVSIDHGLSGDPDLDIIMAPTISFDASILEFDFIPTSDTIKFRYVFGSDEYMEFVSPTPGGINDGFGFFISGPGISGPFSSGAINIALIPGTTLPVTMFNLNLFTNSAYYFDNGDGLGTGTAPDGSTVQYDGFTVPLTAIANVQCGETYHIKLAIADGGDGIIDSGVFLEEGSFASLGNILITPSTSFAGISGLSDTMIYEGCGSASVLFDRSTTSNVNADTLLITYTGTAINGVDFAFVSDTVFYAPGQDSAYVTINTLADTNTEGIETITISFLTSVSCGGNDTMSVTLYIIDTPPLTLSVTNDTLLNCPASDIILSAQASGGVGLGELHYTWTGSSNPGDSIHVSPLSSTTYYVTVTDTCGNSLMDSVVVTIVPYTPLEISLTEDIRICEGLSAFLEGNVWEGRPDYMYHWNPAVTMQDSITVKPEISTSYTFTATDQCGYSVSDEVTVTVVPAIADFSYFFTTNQSIQFNNSSEGAASYLWNFGDASVDSTSIIAEPFHDYTAAGTYTVTLIIQNSEGCTDTTTQIIVVQPDFYFYYPNSFSPNGNGLNDIYLTYGKGIKIFHMDVFNKWGELLFSSDDITKGWDGFYKGSMVPPGVYVGTFYIEGYRDQLKQFYTDINVIR
jgi:gliding motility-associated-like protein